MEKHEVKVAVKGSKEEITVSVKHYAQNQDTYNLVNDNGYKDKLGDYMGVDNKKQTAKANVSVESAADKKKRLAKESEEG